MLRDAADGGLDILRSDRAPNLDQTADVIRDVADGHRRGLPEFPLWQGQRVQPDGTALKPLFESGALISGHRLATPPYRAVLCGSGSGSSSVSAAFPSSRSMSSSVSASMFTSSVVAAASTGAGAAFGL